MVDKGITLEGAWSIPGVKQVQRAIFQQLVSISPFSSVHVLSTRFLRWGTPEQSSKVALALNQRLSDLRPCNRPKAAVMADWLKTVFNGWCTARRFQESGTCRLSQGCAGEDDIAHYVGCPEVHRCLRLCLLPVPTSPFDLVGGEAREDDDFITSCIVCSVLRAAHNHARVTQQCLSQAELLSAMRARLKSLGQTCDTVARILRQRQRMSRYI